MSDSRKSTGNNISLCTIAVGAGFVVSSCTPELTDAMIENLAGVAAYQCASNGGSWTGTTGNTYAGGYCGSRPQITGGTHDPSGGDCCRPGGQAVV